MHNFLLFYAPLLIVVMAMTVSFFVAVKSTKYED
ncbi:cytochrome bd oxidase small subunit CydS [Halalkalibacter alkalisediminis]|uniref:Cbb3-type cytochrome oxidase assembly protein CcoS n=1 Tax=Halalkalibacter alkalisediminis TaxID=935616 RepID=A0ABV6NFM4_9BACI